MSNRRHFSTNSIRVLADNINSELGAPTLESFLQTLSQIDAEIQKDFDHVRAQLATSEKKLVEESERRARAESQLTLYGSRMSTKTIKLSTSAECNCHPANTFFTGTHKTGCPLRTAIMSEPAANVADLLLAREDAFRNQTVLVERLKRDNNELKESYDKLWAKKNALHAENEFDEESIGNLRDRVKQAGQAATRVEERLKITARDVDSFRKSVSHSVRMSKRVSGDTTRFEERFEQLGMSDMDCGEEASELLRTLQLQQEAHEKLRATVIELMQELERIDPRKMGRAGKYSELLDKAETKLRKAEEQVRRKEGEITELKRQQKKVLAEYEAISVAHSYSTAELSRIRAHKRDKTKKLMHDRQDRKILGGGMENLLHNRKLHFR